MKYVGMPMGMWLLFQKSFQKQLTEKISLSPQQAMQVKQRANGKYKEIIARMPEFEKDDQFRMNLVNSAMIGAFILCMPQRPEVSVLTEYYRDAMMTPPMQWFCRMSGKNKFSENDIESMKKTEQVKPADRNT